MSDAAKVWTGTEPGRRDDVPAGVVWHRALELAGTQQDERLMAVLELLRAARHDVATILADLMLGRAEVRTRPSDLTARRALRMLGDSVAFLGGTAPATAGRETRR